MICINANGETHACFHETKSYGNVLDIGLSGVWKNLQMWRDNSLLPEDCKKCKWNHWCEGACRVYAEAIDKPDFMCRGSTQDMPDPIEDYQKSIHLIDDNGTYKVRRGMRYREENGFWLFHIVGAWTTKVSPEVAEFLIQQYNSDKLFLLKEFPEDEKSLADLLTKKIVEPA